MAPADLRAEAEAIVARMSLDERVAAVSGRDWWTTVGCARLGVPSVWLSDGPHGLRKCKSSAVVGGGLSLTTEAHCYPTAVTLGSSFDVDLAEAVGDGIGAEARYRGVGVVLGPGVNLKRSPLCGRNFEYLRGPYVSGALGAAWVRGCQRNAGIGASVKHFAANNQESNRMFCDSRVDARTLRELYLPAFEMVVKEAKPWTVMTAHNRVNGAYCSEHDWLAARAPRRAYESECYDRLGLDLPPDQDALIAAVAATRRDVVVVLQNGSPVAMPWVGDVAAVLEMYLAGEASAAAHPSARTFGKMRQVVYDDRLDVGYRHFARPRHARDVLFPFGHGLSYTTFTYGEIALTPGAGACDPELRVAVANAGAVAGSEVVQLYVSERNPRLRRPLFELKRFAKLFLEPGPASRGGDDFREILTGNLKS
ncbi:scopolin beta-glucosidase [Aureococcus anophagefferens]|nr:scopolin beta-glucosidase [Aureococcus anophagefferens]